MQTLASRPSEARIKTYERSESIVAFAFLNPQQVFAKNCPQPSETRSKRTSFNEFIGQFSSFFLQNFFLILFKYFLKAF